MRIEPSTCTLEVAKSGALTYYAMGATRTCRHGNMSPREHVATGTCRHGNMSPREHVATGTCRHGNMSPREHVATGTCRHGKFLISWSFSFSSTLASYFHWRHKVNCFAHAETKIKLREKGKDKPNATTKKINITTVENHPKHKISDSPLNQQNDKDEKNQFMLSWIKRKLSPEKEAETANTKKQLRSETMSP